MTVGLIVFAVAVAALFAAINAGGRKARHNDGAWTAYAGRKIKIVFHYEPDPDPGFSHYSMAVHHLGAR